MAKDNVITQGNELWKRTQDSVMDLSPTGTIFTETTVNLQNQFEDLISTWGMTQISNVIINPVFTRAGDAVDTIDCFALFDVSQQGPIRSSGNGKGDRMNILTYTNSGAGSGGYSITPEVAAKFIVLVDEPSIGTDSHGNRKIILKKLPDYRDMVGIHMDFFALMAAGLKITANDDLDFRIMTISKLGSNNYSMLIAKYIDTNNRKKGKTGRSIDYNKVVASMTGRNGRR